MQLLKLPNFSLRTRHDASRQAANASGRISSSVSPLASLSLNSELAAPFSIESEVGEVIYTLDGAELGRAKILTEYGMKKISFWDVFLRMFSKMLLK